MIKTNKAMNKIINNKINYNLKEPDIVDRIIKSIIKKLYFVNECVIYSEDKIKKEDIDSVKILELCKNKTNYEIGCNEIIYPKEILNPDLYQILGEKLKKELCKKYNVKFMIYISEQKINDFFEIRFHIDRTNDGENLWLNDDLEKYKEPIMVIY